MPNYSILSKFEQEEKDKLDFQKTCSHTYWSTRCGVCNKILASDHHVNFHTKSCFKMDNTIAILLVTDDPIDVYRIQKIAQLKEEYDEIVVLADSVYAIQLYTGLKNIDKVATHNLEEEIAHMRKYRKEDVVSITLLLESKDELLQEQCKKLKIISKYI